MLIVRVVVQYRVAGNTNGIGGNDDDELIESLVKTVTATPGANTRTTQRERKRTKDAHRKSREYTKKTNVFANLRRNLGQRTISLRVQYLRNYNMLFYVN